MNKILTLILLFSFAASSFADDSSDTIGVVMKCAALFNMLAKSTSSNQEEYETHMLHEIANGSFVMAYHMADESNLKREYVDSVYSEHESYYKTLENLAVKSDNSDEYQAQIHEDMPVCVEINKVQAEYIQNLKKEMYKKE